MLSDSKGDMAMPAKTKNKVTANDLAITKLIREQTAEHEKAVKAGAPTPQKEWRVDGVPGLSLAIKPSGVFIFYVRFMAGKGARRKQVRQAIGHANGPTPTKLSEAKAKAIKIATDGPQGDGGDVDASRTLGLLLEQLDANTADP